MHKLTLHYFDFHGGRGEVARLALSLGGIAFEDHRIAPADWPAVRNDMPFAALPVLDVDDEAFTQSNSINRFVGKLAGLYPDDPIDALRCDEIMAAVEDILVKVGPTFAIKDEAEKKSVREKLAGGPLTLYLQRLEKLLLARGGQYFVAGRLTIADLKVFVWVRSLRSGILDYIPADLCARVAPELLAHCDRVAAEPGIVAYYAAS